jgi:hypothetical protein
LIQQIYKQYARNLNYNHSIRSFAEKTLTLHEEITMKTLVVTPSFKRNTINAKKYLPSTSAHHLVQLKTQIGRKKSDLTMSE